MGKLILVNVTAIYDDVELDQDEETGDPIQGSWTEHRRDWFYEDREDTFPEGNVVLTWERGKWDYDTRFGIYLIWKDPWMTIAADTYIARTLASVGWNVTTPPGGWTGAARYPPVDGVVAAANAVDRVLLSTEPFPFPWCYNIYPNHQDDCPRQLALYPSDEEEPIG